MIPLERLEAIANGDLGSAAEATAIARTLLELLAAKARKSDPETSKRAASGVNKAISGNRLAVLRVARTLRNPWTDAELISEYRKHRDLPAQTDSGIRSRRAELARLGHCSVVCVDSLLSRGRSFRRWLAIVDDARPAVVD